MCPPPRRSGASSSCSSYYSTSAAKAQLLSQMKDFTDNRDRDEDDELTYKVTRSSFSCYFTGRVGKSLFRVCCNRSIFHSKLTRRRCEVIGHVLPVIFILRCLNNSPFVVQKQLMESLRKKLGVLREAQRGLQEDIRANAQLGEEVGRNFTLFIHQNAELLAATHV